MKKYDLSHIMTRAWKIFRKVQVPLQKLFTDHGYLQRLRKLTRSALIRVDRQQALQKK